MVASRLHQGNLAGRAIARYTSRRFFETSIRPTTCGFVCPHHAQTPTWPCARSGCPGTRRSSATTSRRLHGVFPLKKDGYRAERQLHPRHRALTALAKSRGIRYLFAVVDARDLPTSRALTARGFSLIETRLYFHQSLRNYHYPRRFRCRLATDARCGVPDGTGTNHREPVRPIQRRSVHRQGRGRPIDGDVDSRVAPSRICRRHVHPR